MPLKHARTSEGLRGGPDCLASRTEELYLFSMFCSLNMQWCRIKDRSDVISHIMFHNINIFSRSPTGKQQVAGVGTLGCGRYSHDARILWSLKHSFWTVPAHRMPECLGLLPMSAPISIDASTLDYHFFSHHAWIGWARIRSNVCYNTYL